ncbi:hypothetical protein ABMB67_001994 [Halalkalibacter oceani]
MERFRAQLDSVRANSYNTSKFIRKRRQGLAVTLGNRELADGASQWNNMVNSP